MAALLIAIIVTIVLAFLIKKTYKNPWTHLPSPGIQLPFFGHLSVLLTDSKDPINYGWDLYKKYSKDGILFNTVFNFNTLIVGDFDSLKYLFNHPDVQERNSSNFHTDTFTKLVKEERDLPPGGPLEGVIFSQGSVWAEQRRFTLRTLKDFGFGKSGMEGMIQEELMKFRALLETYGKEPIDIAGKMNLPIINALWRVTAGEDFEYDNPVLVDLLTRMTEFLKRIGRPEAVFLFGFPWIAQLWPSFLGRDEDIKINREIMNMMKTSINNHKETLDTNEPRDYIDKYLIEIQNTNDPSSSFFGDKGINNLAANLMDLFLAGSETTSTTLTWAILYMVRNQDAQEKVQKELDTVLGRYKIPSLADKPSLPYTDAVLMEIQRCANIVPDGVAHYTRKDVTLNGVIIPKDTFIQPLNVEILKGDYWLSGKTFKPERFLDEEGKAKKDDHLVPFSIGKRQCLGETLAKSELFIFFGGILQYFKIEEEIPGILPSEDYIVGATTLPQPFKIRLVKRNQ